MAITISGDSPNFTTFSATTISDGTNSTSATNPIKGSARAWVNFNGSTGSIRSSYNVSSITINGTGNYTITYTTALPNANYSVAGSNAYLATGTGGNKIWLSINGTNGITTTSVNVVTESYTAMYSCDTVTVMVMSS
jgi:hypothetical protein